MKKRTDLEPDDLAPMLLKRFAPTLLTLWSVASSNQRNVTNVPFGIEIDFEEKAMFWSFTVLSAAPATPAVGTTIASSTRLINSSGLRRLMERFSGCPSS